MSSGKRKRKKLKHIRSRGRGLRRMRAMHLESKRLKRGRSPTLRDWELRFGGLANEGTEPLGLQNSGAGSCAKRDDPERLARCQRNCCCSTLKAQNPPFATTKKAGLSRSRDYIYARIESSCICCLFRRRGQSTAASSPAHRCDNAGRSDRSFRVLLRPARTILSARIAVSYS
jgi:hypothetical protein